MDVISIEQLLIDSERLIVKELQLETVSVISLLANEANSEPKLPVRTELTDETDGAAGDHRRHTLILTTITTTAIMITTIMIIITQLSRVKDSRRRNF